MADFAFRIIMDGEAARGGRMRIRELADTLLALEGLVERAYEVLGGPSGELHVAIQPQFHLGSLVFNGVIQAAQALSDIWGFARSPDGAAIMGLLGLIGPAHAALRGVCQLLKRRSDGHAPPPASVQAVMSRDADGDRLAREAAVLRLYGDSEIRRGFEQLTAPLRAGRLDFVAFQDAHGTQGETIRAADAESFRAEPPSFDPRAHPDFGGPGFGGFDWVPPVHPDHVARREDGPVAGPPSGDVTVTVVAGGRVVTITRRGD